MTALAILAASLEKFARRDSRPAEDGDRRGRGAVRPRPEGLVGDAAQAQSDRLRADHRAGAADSRATRWPRSRTSRSGTSATFRTRRSSGDPARQFHRARSHAAPLHAHRVGHGRVSGPDDGESPAIARRGVLGHGAARAGRRGVSREQAYEWVQRNAMRSFHEQRDFKELLLADPDVAGARAAARRSTRRSTSTRS